MLRLHDIKYKVVCIQAMKVCRGSEDYIHSFLTSALHGGEWSTLSSGRFRPGNELRQPLNRRLGGPQGRCGRFEEDENICSLTGFESRRV